MYVFVCVRVCKMNNAVKDITEQNSMQAFLPILLGKIFRNNKVYITLVYFFIVAVYSFFDLGVVTCIL